MSWVRSNLKLGARLALIALALQFVMSFGHVHADVARAASPAISAIAIAQVAPSGDTDNDATGHVCDICAVMSLAQSVLSSTPPALLLPQAVDLLHLTTSAEFAHLNVLRGPFQPRAPPVS